MAVKITTDDMEGLYACTEYLEIQPQVRIQRPPGAPEMPGVPATATRSAQPGRPAEGPRPWVLVELVDERGNTFVAIENNTRDRGQQEKAARVREILSSARDLANRIRNAGNTGDYVRADMDDAAEAITILAAALQP